MKYSSILITIVILTFLKLTAEDRKVSPLTQEEIIQINYSNYQGKFSFSNERNFQLPNGTIIKQALFSLSDVSGNALLFFLIDDKNNRELLRIPPNESGPALIHESTIFIPDFSDKSKDSVTDILIQWRVPGNGGIRVYQKFRLKDNKMTVVLEYSLETNRPTGIEVIKEGGIK